MPDEHRHHHRHRSHHSHRHHRSSRDRSRSRDRTRHRDRSPRRNDTNELYAQQLRDRLRRDNKEDDKKTEDDKPQLDKTEDQMTGEELLRHERQSTHTDKSTLKAMTEDEYNEGALSKHIKTGTIDLRKTDIQSAKRLSDKLSRCQLCIENDHCCDMVSMGDKVYLTTPPTELVEYSALIVPVSHVKNTLHCDEEEWEEIRNYMISLSQFYYTKLNKSVVFYETAVDKYGHAGIVAVPIPMSLASSVQGYFKQSMLEEMSDVDQHHKLIDTQKKTIRHSIAKEAPYFHVWFNLDGGLGLIVEDTRTWPRGDLFARGILGGLLKLDPFVIRDKGHTWQRGDPRVVELSKVYSPFDWAEKLHE